MLCLLWGFFKTSISQLESRSVACWGASSPILYICLNSKSYNDATNLALCSFQCQIHAHTSPVFARLKHVHPPEVKTPKLRECESCVCVCAHLCECVCVCDSTPQVISVFCGWQRDTLETQKPPLGWNFPVMAKSCLPSAWLVAWLLQQVLVFMQALKMTKLRSPDPLE